MPSAGSSGSKASTAGLLTGRLLVGVALTAAIVLADLDAEPPFADAGRLVERAFEFAIGDVSSEIGAGRTSATATASLTGGPEGRQ
jgi:hypothetical protein